MLSGSGHPPTSETMNLASLAGPAQGISLAKALRAWSPGKARSPDRATEHPAGAEDKTLLPHTFREAGQNPEAPYAWTDFGIGRAVRLLRLNCHGSMRLALRRLHVRWWHSSHYVRQMLERFGVAEETLKMFP